MNSKNCVMCGKYSEYTNGNGNPVVDASIRRLSPDINAAVKRAKHLSKSLSRPVYLFCSVAEFARLR